MNFIRQSVWLPSLEIVHGCNAFHMFFLFIGKIMDMWLTSIKNFSDGGINTRYSPWVW
jgi:hypothetical protein